MARKVISKVNNGKRIIVKKPELLAPAGNLEKLKIAIMYGADAVYIGGQEFGLRANADNFTIEEIKEAAEFAKENNAKVYVTTNIIAHNEDVYGLEEYLKALGETGITGVIFADPIIIETARSVAPNLELHLSTQQSTINYKAVKYWEEQGLERVVLAREASKEEIKTILLNTNIEIETFIHGSMCISYSGRCTLSNHMTARDSNRGGCSQNCRWEFDLREDGTDLFTQDDVKFSFSPKDLSLINSIPEMIELGIDCLKIEGRMRSIHYIATVVSTYRKLIDKYSLDPDNFDFSDFYNQEISKSANRDLAPQYFSNTPGVDEQMFDHRNEHPTQEFIGVVLDYNDESEIATIEQRNFFKTGDMVEIFGPNIDTFKFTVGDIINSDNDLVDAARHPKEIVTIKIPKRAYKFDMMRKVR